ncbi:MAG: hypothetical protein M3Y32_04520 [Pseudomonadota bacterium]|nr:hypothetical protein [Pseudomonadota bacterium]
MRFDATQALRALALAATLLAGSAQADVVWNEANNGDFSNDGLAPTFVTVTAGSNTIIGSTGRSATTNIVDRDYFSITVPTGHVWTSMMLLPGSAGIGGGAFLGLMAGPQFTVPPSTQTAAGLLGWTVYEEGNIGSDLLLSLAVPGLGSSGFQIPLPAGTYSFWVQELSVGVAPYNFELGIAAVPEAPTAMAMLAGLAMLGAVLRKRR